MQVVRKVVAARPRSRASARKLKVVVPRMKQRLFRYEPDLFGGVLTYEEVREVLGAGYLPARPRWTIV